VEDLLHGCERFCRHSSIRGSGLRRLWKAARAEAAGDLKSRRSAGFGKTSVSKAKFLCILLSLMKAVKATEARRVRELCPFGFTIFQKARLGKQRGSRQRRRNWALPPRGSRPSSLDKITAEYLEVNLSSTPELTAPLPPRQLQLLLLRFRPPVAETQTIVVSAASLKPRRRLQSFRNPR